MRKKERLIKKLAECNLSTKVGEFKMFVYKDKEGREHVALVKGKIKNGKNLPCRVHSSWRNYCLS